MGLSERDLGEWVRASCARHKVPEKVIDPLAISEVAALLTGERGRPGRQAQRGRGSAVRLDPPDRIDASGVERTCGSAGRIDDDVIQEGGDDRVLPAEVEVGPSAA